MLSSGIKSIWIVASLILILFSFSHRSFAAVQLQPSPALQTIFNQTNDTYFGPPIVNATLKGAFNQAPEAFATTVGMTLQRQKEYVRNQPKYFPQYQKLEAEAESFMRQVARFYRYKHPGDGSPLPEERMLAEFLRGLNGDLNQTFIQKFGIDPAQVDLPLMLAQVPLPKNNSDYDEAGRLQIKKDSDGLVLLGEEAHSSEDSSAEVDEPSDEVDNSSSYSGEGPYISQVICPQQNNSLMIKVDTNNNPKDKTYVGCFYGDDHLLNHQEPQVNSIRHGVSFRFSRGSSRDPKPQHIFEKTPFTNGKINGVVEHYGYCGGNYGISTRNTYINGTRTKFEKFWCYYGATRYMREHTIWFLNGNSNKPKEEMTYYHNESKHRHYTYDATGQAVNDACWDKNGQRKKCH